MTDFTEDEYLQLSGIQHFLYCRRQWALIHIENLWTDNLRTVEGEILHERAHDETLSEKRGDIIIARGINVFSHRLGVSGKCDVVEFHNSDSGINIFGWEGLWLPYPVEYKRGEAKQNDCDAAQLCAQAICLEEMLLCNIRCGALYYGKTHRRVTVDFTDELREKVSNAAEEMHLLYKRGYTPKTSPSKGCYACSLKDYCLPELMKRQSVKDYLEENL